MVEILDILASKDFWFSQYGAAMIAHIVSLSFIIFMVFPFRKKIIKANIFITKNNYNYLIESNLCSELFLIKDYLPFTITDVKLEKNYPIINILPKKFVEHYHYIVPTKFEIKKK